MDFHINNNYQNENKSFQQFYAMISSHCSFALRTIFQNMQCYKTHYTKTLFMRENAYKILANYDNKHFVYFALLTTFVC